MSNPGDAQAAGGALSVMDAASAIGALSTVNDGDGGANAAETKAEQVEETAPSETEETEGEQPDESEGEEQSEPSEETEEAAQQPPKFRVKVNGEEVEVTQDELLKGYSREQDYTRKTQATAEERKALEAEKAAIAQERERYSQLLGGLTEQLSKPLYDPAEMEQLRLSQEPAHRAEYAARAAEEHQRQQHLNGIQTEQARIAQQKAQEAEQAHNQRLRDEATKLLTKLPEWKDPEKAKADKETIWKYGLSEGFSPEEMQSTADHRIMLVLKKAAAYDALQSKKPEVLPKVEAVKTLKPSTSTHQPSQKTEVVRARERFARSNSVRDAAALIALTNTKG